MGVEIRGTRDLICRCKKAEIRESHLEAKMEWQLKINPGVPRGRIDKNVSRH